MRSNRPSYSAAPAGSAKALDQKPKPKRSKREMNQRMLMVFFMVLPVLGLLAIFFQPFRWLFMLAVVAALVVMWLRHAFLFPGRMIISAVYGLLLVFTLVTALSAQEKEAIRHAQNKPFPTAPMPSTTPAFAVGAEDPMGVQNPDGFTAFDPYAQNVEDPLAEVGLSGGSEDQNVLNGLEPETTVEAYMPETKSGAEIALENFMEKWRKNVVADMVEYTPDSWKKAQEPDLPEHQLFWKFGQKQLMDWRQMSAPTGTEESTARTITIQADVMYSGETRTYEYDAIVLFENDKWVVDPDSLSTGILVVAGTPTPDPNATPTPTPEPTQTPPPSGKTKLYYNKNGGKYYHSRNDCPSVSDKYLPLKGTFQYKDINKSPYDELEPCKRCNPPPRP